MSGAGLNDPINFPQNWDTVICGGLTSPGVCEISGFKRTHEWDTKKGKGTKGGTSTFVQKPPVKGQVTFKAWTPQHFTDWEVFYQVFVFDPTKKTVTGIDIYHPALADIEVFAVLTVDIGMWEHKGSGLYERVVQLLEYFPTPPKPALGTPGKATGYTNPNSKKTGTQPDDAGAAIQKGTDALGAAATTP